MSLKIVSVLLCFFFFMSSSLLCAPASKRAHFGHSFASFLALYSFIIALLLSAARLLSQCQYDNIPLWRPRTTQIHVPVSLPRMRQLAEGTSGFRRHQVGGVIASIDTLLIDGTSMSVRFPNCLASIDSFA